MRVRSYTDPPQSLLQYRSWLLRRSDGVEERVQVLQAHWEGRLLRATLEGIADRTAAERLRGSRILIERDALPRLARHEYYQEALIGFTVYNTEGVLFGELTHFLQAPAGALMVVRGERERWLPALSRYLRRVDLSRRQIEVDWPADF